MSKSFGADSNARKVSLEKERNHQGTFVGGDESELASAALDWCQSEQWDEMPHTFLWEDLYPKATKTVQPECPVTGKR